MTGQAAEVKPGKFDILVLYNGLIKSLTVTAEEVFKAVLQHAIGLFGSPPNPHTLSLFSESGAELSDGQHVRDSGLAPGSRVILRPSTVKGGIAS